MQMIGGGEVVGGDGGQTAEITEGVTRILVPRESLTSRDPPRDPAFFNPKARMNRDVSVAAYKAFAGGFDGPITMIDCMAGVGPRGLRAANESGVSNVVINDLNGYARGLVERSVALNGLGKTITVTGREACRLCSDFAEGGKRAAIVDIDPFGSPARFIDCAMRATMHGGMLAVTATDLQVLNGLFQNACKRRYGGVPVRAKYGNETAIRLVLGCMRHIAARMDMEIAPLFVESDMHYYRAFVRMYRRPDQCENTGYIAHCRGCLNREAINEHRTECRVCGAKAELAGPLWTGELFDAGFVRDMQGALAGLDGLDRRCARLLAVAESEAGMPAAYYTLDEIAARMGSSPIKMEVAVKRLQGAGYAASATSLDPTGFRTDAAPADIAAIFGS